MQNGITLLSNRAPNSKQITPKIEREVEKLCALGPRAVLEFIREIDRGGDPWERLERYAKISWATEFLHANDGDKFLPAMFSIDGGR